jgi:hypothetical protein
MAGGPAAGLHADGSDVSSRPADWNQQGQQISMKADPVHWPQRRQSRSQQRQQASLAVKAR